MRLSKLCASALAAGTAHGYLNTSPFFMFSTSELLTSSSKLQTSSAIISDVSQALSHCPSDLYILVSQPGVTSKDYTSSKSTPALARRLSSKAPADIRSSTSIPEVHGAIDLTTWHQLLHHNCGVQTTEIDASTNLLPTSYDQLPRLINVHFPMPSQGNKVQDLAQNDAFFASLMDLIPSQNYTVLYTTSPGMPHRSPVVDTEANEYKMESDIQEALHVELKRDMGLHEHEKRNNQTMIDGPLFDKYQFFTPGIFMGFLVGFLLLSILYVGISALASLQVSYAAFDKEQGQLAMKKTQ